MEGDGMNNAQLKELLGRAVAVIDEWDLVNGCDPVGQAGEIKEIMEVLLLGSAVAGKDPNKLLSLQEFLKEQPYEFVIKRK
jgi:hypothetical protein